MGPEDIFGQNPLRDSEFPEPRLLIRAVFFFNANPDPDLAAFSMYCRSGPSFKKLCEKFPYEKLAVVEKKISQK